MGAQEGLQPRVQYFERTTEPLERPRYGATDREALESDAAIDRPRARSKGARARPCSTRVLGSDLDGASAVARALGVARVVPARRSSAHRRRTRRAPTSSAPR